jgi:hypothetical protein
MHTARAGYNVNCAHAGFVMWVASQHVEYIMHTIFCVWRENKSMFASFQIPLYKGSAKVFGRRNI